MRDPDRDHTVAPAPRPSTARLLAALERASRHHAAEARAVPAWAILAHLGIARRSAAATAVRRSLRELERTGSVERSHRHGVEVWELAAAGGELLRRARRARRVPALPESPQHRAWRDSRRAAGQEIERFRGALGELLGRGADLLAADPPPRSDTWLELGESLRLAARRLGSASHCLYEWAEPDDARADVDVHEDPGDRRLDPARRDRLRALRAGRRNIRLWESGG
jgi:hypothetical protein